MKKIKTKIRFNYTLKMDTHVEWGQFVELDPIVTSNDRYYKPKRQKQKYYHHYLQIIKKEQTQQTQEEQNQPPQQILTVSLPFSKKKMRLYMKKKSLFIYSSFTISLLCLIIIFYL